MKKILAAVLLTFSSLPTFATEGSFCSLALAPGEVILQKSKSMTNREVHAVSTAGPLERIALDLIGISREDGKTNRTEFLKEIKRFQFAGGLSGARNANVIADVESVAVSLSGARETRGEGKELNWILDRRLSSQLERRFESLEAQIQSKKGQYRLFRFIKYWSDDYNMNSGSVFILVLLDVQSGYGLSITGGAVQSGDQFPF